MRPVQSADRPYHAMTSSDIDLPFTKRTLANGLDVIVHEDHHVPIVAVNIWYHVGSKNERPGRTGFAHLFEHLMFEGSEHHNKGYFPPLQQAGALLNGSTNTDRTNYWEVVPTSAVDLALWMESDRMGYLLPALTPERFETQRDVVLNERRQNYENRPYGMAIMALSGGALSRRPPVHWMTIGSADDIRAMQLEDVQAFFRTYYHPANASLVLAGDIDTERAFDLAEQYFGDLTPGTRPAPVVADASLTREHRLVLEDRVELPRIYMAWLSPAMFARRRRGAGPGRRSPGQRQDVAALSHAGLRAADRAGRVGASALARAGKLLPAGGDGRTRPVAGGPVGGDRRRARAACRRTGRPTARWSVRWRRPRRTSSTGCRRSADSAASPISSTPTTCCAATPVSSRPTSTATAARRTRRSATPSQRHLRRDARVVLSVIPRGQPALALAGSEPVSVS